MKTIFLMRHAKSDWGADFDTDHERPLNKRGRKAVTLMGRYLTALGQVPDGIVSSSAVRAYDTARGAAKAGEWKCPIERADELYDASPTRVLEIIRQLDDSRQTVLLAGHEPTWSDLAGALIGGASMRFPTAAVARIDLDVDSWRQAEFGSGMLVWFVIPKLLSQIGWPDGQKSKK